MMKVVKPSSASRGVIGTRALHTTHVTSFLEWQKRKGFVRLL